MCCGGAVSKLRGESSARTRAEARGSLAGWRRGWRGMRHPTRTDEWRPASVSSVPSGPLSLTSAGA